MEVKIRITTIRILHIYLTIIENPAKFKLFLITHVVKLDKVTKHTQIKNLCNEIVILCKRLLLAKYIIYVQSWESRTILIL